MNIPMKPKYVDEHFKGPLFIFGTSPGGVDVSNGIEDVLTGIPLEIAERILEANREHMEKLYKILT